MNLQTLKLKASTLCAGGTLLVFGGFLTVNLAGCGGGGGGLTTIPTPSPVGATFRILQQDTTPSRGGTLTLTGNGQTFTGTADNNGVVTLNNVTPGTYTATFTANNSSGTALPPTTRPLIVTNTGTQNFTLVQGDTGQGAFTLTGTIFQNPNNGEFTNCGAGSTPVTAPVLISVRDLNDTTGAPIIAQIVRPLQDSNAPIALRGRYTISIPTNPRSFRVEVGPADNNGVAFAGISATTTFTEGTTSLDNVNVCANSNGQIPVPFSPTATPTVTPTPTLPGTTTTENTTTGATTTENTTTENTTTGTTTTGTTTAGTTTTGTTTAGTTTAGTTTAGNTTAGNTTTANTPGPTSTPFATSTPNPNNPTPSFTPLPNVATGGNTGGMTSGAPTATPIVQTPTPIVSTNRTRR